MNSINNLNALSMEFDNPWLLLLIIPAVALMLLPYFRLPKQHRRTRNRVISLVLHSLILVLTVLMLSGLSFSYTQINVKKDVVLLVDASDSIEASEDDMSDFIKSVLADVEPDYNIGVVTFANGCVYSSRMSANDIDVDKIFSGQTEAPSGDATDISAALLYSRELLASPENGRIILLSDGQQTDGNALVTVKALADEGVRVDTVYFPSEGYDDEVMISSVEVQLTDDVANILVTTQSTNAQAAVLTLYDNDVPAAEQTVNLSGGQDVFSFEQSMSASAMHVIRVDIRVERDTLTENNTCYSFANLKTATKTLLVDGSGKGAEALKGLMDGNFDVTLTTPDRLPTSIEELCGYNEVIFMNVANSDLPAGFDVILSDYVQLYGGGLYTIGGGKSYIRDDMVDTKYQELLPVEANTDAKSLGLLLIIDSSSSMDEIVDGGTTRMELAIEAAVASVEALSPDDYVGVVSFNTQATAVVEMSSMERKDSIIRNIRGIETATGTYYYNALDVARNMLQTFSATELKHVIFLTDGEPVDADKAGFMDLIDRMARNDITISTIALGASVSTDTAKEMAERGGGRFYSVERESELTRIMVEETTTAAGRYYNELLFTPVIISHTSAVAGIKELPQLGGYYGTRLKDGATMVLGYEGSPIYAEWRCGLGRVGSFMCDLEGNWSAEYFTDENGIRFIINTVSSLLSKEINSNDGDITVSFAEDNYTSRAVISARLADDEIIVAQVETPDGNTVHLKLEQLTEATFAGTFRTEVPGVYALKITKIVREAEEEYVFYTAFSYSKEYVAFADDSECFKFMESLSESGNGSMLFSAENLFGRENETVESNYNPALLFLIICAVLFLLDIVVRKFKIKWPNEIREERRQKASSERNDE